MTDEILHLGFAYARARAAQLKAAGGDRRPSALAQEAGVGDDLAVRRAAAQSEVVYYAAKVSSLQARLQRSAKRDRNLISVELAAAQGQLDLA
ncbi:MAG TPA: hypothetical protein VHS07_03930, partial [Candidatus Binataceae bacterium]|nr:hypothetical protein [Candidatus Binataceae bacterium]